MDSDRLTKLMTEPEELHPDLVPHVTDGPLGLMIHHPLVIEMTYRKGFAGMPNASYAFKKQRSAEYLAKGEYAGYVFLHERPYRFQTFQDISDKIPVKAYWPLLREVWEDSENIFENLSMWEEAWLGSVPTKVMDKEEKKVFKSLPAYVTIYRGVQKKSYAYGMSFTVDRDRAVWFANRWQKKGERGFLITGNVHKTGILGYLNGRGEKEIVTYYDDVENIEITETIK